MHLVLGWANQSHMEHAVYVYYERHILSDSIHETSRRAGHARQFECVYVPCSESRYHLITNDELLTRYRQRRNIASS